MQNTKGKEKGPLSSPCLTELCRGYPIVLITTMLPAGPRCAIADNDDKVVLQEKVQGRVGGPRKVISVNMLRQEGVRKEPSKR